MSLLKNSLKISKENFAVVYQRLLFSLRNYNVRLVQPIFRFQHCYSVTEKRKANTLQFYHFTK